MRIIKKYENRSLYDTETSAYVSLHDLRQYVVDNIDFQVVTKGGEDVTRSYLLQIILELECLDAPLFSKEMLEQIIRFYGGPLQHWMQSYLQQSISTVTQQQEALKSTVGANFTDFTSSLEEITKANFAVWQQWLADTRKKNS